MQNLETLRKKPISNSEEELDWLRENGGGGEGILLFTTALIDPFSERQAVYFSVKRKPDVPVKIHNSGSYLMKKCQIGEKSLGVTNFGLIGASL